MPDNDLQVRTLFTDAAGDVPPGIDLLHGFRARQAARRVRGRVALAHRRWRPAGRRHGGHADDRDRALGPRPAHQRRFPDGGAELRHQRDGCRQTTAGWVGGGTVGPRLRGV